MSLQDFYFENLTSGEDGIICKISILAINLF